METGIPADVWRFYIFWNRPETSDSTFTWADFEEKVNGELIGNLGNLVNRTLTFVSRYYNGTIPDGVSDEAFWDNVTQHEQRITQYLERADLRDAFREIFTISDIANKRFQEEEPWKARNENPQKAASLVKDLCYVLKDLAILIHPYMPKSAERLAAFFGFSIGPGALAWKDLGVNGILKTVQKPEVLFQKLEHATIELLRERYSGSQNEREAREHSKGTATTETASPSKEEEPHTQAAVSPTRQESPEKQFSERIDLRVARIVNIERHPKADKLYIETLDDGSGNPRIIVSGLVPFYKEEELLGKQIILVNNLKPAKLRGIESAGMLLAASIDNAEGHERVEVLTAPHAKPGERVVLETPPDHTDAPPQSPPLGAIDASTFFSIPIIAKDGYAWVGETRLSVAGEPIKLEIVRDGEIG